MAFKKGHIPWNKGKSFSGMSGKNHSKKTLKKMSESQKGNKHGFKKGTSGMKGRHHSIVTREKISKGRKGKHHRKKSKRKTSITLKQLFKEGKIKPFFKKGNISWNKNKKMVDLIPNYIHPNQNKHHSKKTRKKISKSKKGIKASEESKKKMSESQIKLWQNPEFKEKQLKKMLKGMMKRPTSYEQKIIDLCNKHNLPFKYIGNGQVIIEGLNPDFIGCNGLKLLIEPHCRFWHSADYEKRAEIFAKYGYKTLFLYDEHLNCEKWEAICLDKIKQFMRDNYGKKN